MNNSIKDLCDISRFYGSNKDFVLGGGGNTSYKDEKYLWVKASGIPLATIDEDGFVQLDRSVLNQMQGKAYSEDTDQREREVRDDLMKAITDPGKGRRPSVETSLHNLIGYSYVVHLHPWMVNALLCSRNSKKFSNEIFGEEVLYVPYTDPGFTLFKKLEEEITSYHTKYSADPQIILLENHGIFVSANSTAEVKEIYDSLLNKIRKRIKEFIDIKCLPVSDRLAEVLPAFRMALSVDSLKIASLRYNTIIQHFARSQSEFQKIFLPFTPDVIVYCKAKYLYIEHTSTPESIIESFHFQLKRFRDEYGYDPKIILLKDIGLVAIDNHFAGTQTCLDVFEDLMKVSYYSENFGGPRFMDHNQISFIDHWEVENYRRQVAKGGVASGRVEGKIAIVTGGAQGFGGGITEYLFKEKAHVVIADINDEVGNKFADQLNQAGTKNHAAFVHADVSDPASVKNLMNETVKNFGGLDLLISNAGILNAGSLDEIELPYYQNSISIKFVSLDYSSPESLLYSYKIDKLNKKWQYLGREASLNLVNLKSGTYKIYL
ncbi:MAG: SDR family NAD(P)-dependent oxidoreductase, partial [Bacteroidales bacterium]|nr:SDR family NAD(P)-dependent oxidoreductase [Bacteroidales bacterium]